MNRRLAHTLGPLAVVLVLLGACAPTPGGAAPTVKPAPATSPPAAAVAPPTAAPAPTAPPVAAPVGRVQFASQFVAGDVPAFVAAEKGYFREAGVDVEIVRFGNSTEMVPALSTGQVDAGGIGGTVAMFNSLGRGVPLKLVLDKGTFRPGSGFTALTIRKDLYDSGRARSLADLRGLTLGSLPPARGTSNAAALYAALQRAGLSLDDISLQSITFPDMIPAFANGALDAALMAEPFLSRAQNQGSAVRVMGQDEMYPNFTVSAVCFTPALYADRATARAFVRGYIRAIRDYLGAISRPSGDAERAQMEDLMSRYTGIDAATVSQMVPASFNPNGLPNQESILYGYQYFREQGLIPEPVSDAAMAALWGTELVEEVLRDLGRLPDDYGLRQPPR